MICALFGKTIEGVGTESFLKREFVNDFPYARVKNYCIELQRPPPPRGVLGPLPGFAVSVSLDGSLRPVQKADRCRLQTTKTQISKFPRSIILLAHLCDFLGNLFKTKLIRAVSNLETENLLDGYSDAFRKSPLG